MPLLKFEVQSDYDKVIRLREEIERLEKQLLVFDSNTPAHKITEIENKLASAKGEFTKLTNAALLAGQELEQGFKQRIYEASKGVNDFNKQILEQKEIVRSVQFEIAKISEQYNNTKGTRAASQWEEELAYAQKALQEEQEILFHLTQERDKARISLRNLTDEYKYLHEESSKGSTDIVSNTLNKETPQFFQSQGEFDKIQELRNVISELRNEISNFNGSETELDGLKQRLSDVQQELINAESNAANAASALGPKLGQKASEASQNLFSLNNAIKDQKDEVAKLTQQLNEASASLNSLKETGDLSAIEKQRAEYDALAASLHDAENKLLNLQTAQSQASSEFDNVTRQIEQQDSVMVKMLGGYENYKQIVDQLPSRVKNVITGIQGMTGAAKAFIATPLGAVIAAIVLVLQSLKTWFDSSAEGQMEFARISGYVGGVLNQLKEIVITVGKAIYSAFSDPKKAVSDLWEAIKTNIVNQVHAVGGIFSELGGLIKAAFDLDFDGVKKHFGEMDNQILQFATGVKDLRKGIKYYIDDVHEAAKKNSELSVREQQLHRNRSKWQIEEKKINAAIAEARLKAMKGDAAASKEAQRLIEQKYAKQKEFAQEELDIIKERNSLTTNSQEDYDAEYAAEARLEDLKTQEAQEKGA